MYIPSTSSLLLIGFTLIVTSSESSAKKPHNVLFIMVDDLRPEIRCFQDEHPDTPMHTPYMDSLATQSILFERAYVQQAVCSPSRTSTLTGRRPDTTRVHDLTQYWRHVAGNFTTLPQYLKENGFATAGVGKIFHPGRASGNNDPISWTEKYFTPDETYWNHRNHDTWFAADHLEVQKHPLADMQIADAGIEMMKHLASQEKPFFLGVGFHKPHLPFLFPATFLDLYPLDHVTLPNNLFAPWDMPEVAWSNFDEIRKYDDVRTQYGYGAINTTFPKKFILNLRRAYYASVSYTDSLIGKVLESLKALKLENDTIISLVGDHGWQLGEHEEWCKHTNFELTTRAPFMLSIPGITSGKINKTRSLVEFVDIFPTIVDALGLRVPELCPENSSSILVCREGTSLMPLIMHPEREWKRASFSQYPRMVVSGDVLMGYTMRTDRYRYTEWVEYDTVHFQPLWIKKHDNMELYDHSVDHEENRNLANVAQYLPVVEQLRKELREGWRKALPP